MAGAFSHEKIKKLLKIIKQCTRRQANPLFLSTKQSTEIDLEAISVMFKPMLVILINYLRVEKNVTALKQLHAKLTFALAKK